MDDEASSDLQKCLSEGPMDTDEGPLINENSNGLSHLLTDGEFNSVDAAVVDDSSTSNQAFLNAVELSAGSVGDYLDSNTDGFNTDSFDVGDNAVNFPSDSLNNVLSDGDSRLSATYKMSDVDLHLTETKPETDSSVAQELTTDTGITASDDVTKQSNSCSEIKNHSEDTTEKHSSTEILSDKIVEEKCVKNDKHLKIETVKVTEVTGNSERSKSDIKDNPDKNATDHKMETEEGTVDVNVAKIAENKTDMESALEEHKNETTENPKVDVENLIEIKDKVSGTKCKAKRQEIIEKVTNSHENCAIEEKISMENISVSEKKEVGGAEETEVVSEDELPEVQKPSVKDAENVSDDELPGPKPADLPADTEVVSEDELPASKKESKESRKRKPNEVRDGYDPGSPTSEGETAGKKQAVAKNGESKPVPAEKRSSVEEKPKKKVLPELDKYWKVVNDDPTDFTGWTYLLQYVDQESDVEAAREAYDAFLSHYPYCYGYWRKYADYEKRKGSKKKCLEVLERGLKAIPLSVDLWIHYVNHIKATRTDDHVFIRSQYERAIEACGLEFRSDRLWESYIKWEAENGSALHVTNIYDRLLATPTLGYTSHFDNFQEHVMAEPVSGVVSRSELVRLREEVRETAPPHLPTDLPPGEDEPLDHIASDEEAQAIKERIIAARRKVHKITGEEVAARWSFEEGIKRPYFHVKPLERCQLKNWKAYLEWEKQNGTLKRALVLHERCLIACALYEEFWMRLIKFLEERSSDNPELVAVQRDVLERACTVHHLDKPELHLHWAHFEEAHGNAPRAADILDRIEKACPHLVQIQYRRINLERRRGDYEKCIQLYEGYIASAKSKAVASALAIKYARFLFHVKQDPAAARKALDDAVVKDALNARLHMQRLDLALHTPGTSYEQLEELVMSYEKQEGAEAETCAELAWRRRELADELGPPAAARAAHLHARALHKQLRKRARANKHEPPPHHQPTVTEVPKPPVESIQPEVPKQQVLPKRTVVPPIRSVVKSQYFCRMSAGDFELLLNRINQIISKMEASKRQSVRIQDQFLVTLRYLTSGDRHAAIAAQFHMPVQTVARCVDTVCRALTQALSDEIKLPQGPCEWLEIERHFDSLWNFPHCIGAVDSRLVLMENATNTALHDHKACGVVLLALFDADYKFIYVDCDNWGRKDYCGIFRNTSLYKRIINNTLNFPTPANLSDTSGPVPYVLVAEPVIPMNEHITKLYEGYETIPSNSKESVFNYRASRVTGIGRNVYGVMCDVFKVLQNPIPANTSQLINIAMTCILLHNFLRRSEESRSLYTPPGTFDTLKNGRFYPGTWRTYSDKYTAFALLRHLPRKPNLLVKSIRDNLATHFLSDGADSGGQNLP